jgi:hypothetical protein
MSNTEQQLFRPPGFEIDPIAGVKPEERASLAQPGLGALAAFTGIFTGNGFNTIFRPQSSVTPSSPLPGGDNVLELNLTEETLSFSPPLGSVPNRGFGTQGDIIFNGVPYLQSVVDVTVPTTPVGIHHEPGMWIVVPQTSVPTVGPTVARMASVPHGVTILAEGTVQGPVTGSVPTIPPVSINPSAGAPFASQTAGDATTARIPQDLTSFLNAGTITAAMLTDPNTFIRNHIQASKVIEFFQIDITTSTTEPITGGGVDMISFLLGDPNATPVINGNANVQGMTATFWIEKIQCDLEVPIFQLGDAALILSPPAGALGQPVPRFLIDPPIAIAAPRQISVWYHQIQYSQTVNLLFNGITWPHVSVATLVHKDPISPSNVNWTS